MLRPLSGATGLNFRMSFPLLLRRPEWNGRTRPLTQVTRRPRTETVPQALNQAFSTKACSCGLGPAVGEPVAISHRLAARHAASTCSQGKSCLRRDLVHPWWNGRSGSARSLFVWLPGFYTRIVTRRHLCLQYFLPGETFHTYINVRLERHSRRKLLTLFSQPLAFTVNEHAM